MLDLPHFDAPREAWTEPARPAVGAFSPPRVPPVDDRRGMPSVLASGVMLRASRALLAALPFVLVPAFSLAACVGDDPVGNTTDSGVPSSTTPTGTTPTDGAAPPSDGGADGATSCPTGFADCDGDPATVCETDTRSSAAHCGACARACGGSATCQAGDCQAEKLVDGLPRPFSITLAGQRVLWHQGDGIFGCRADDCSASKAIMVDVNVAATPPTGIGYPHHIYAEGQSFYFSQCAPGSNFDCGIASCDVGGCKLTGSSFVAASNTNRRASFVTGSAGSVFTFQGIDGLYRYDLAAKTVNYESSKYRIGEQLGGIHLGPQHLLFVDDNASQANPSGGLFVCPATGCTTAATRLLPPPVKYLAVAGTTAYVSSGGASAATGSVIACDAAGCGGAGTVLATNQAYVSDLAADAKNVYFATIGAQNVDTNVAAVGTVMRCTNPCTGGPQKVADGIVNPTSIAIDANYVYWLARGTSAGSTGSIWRKRR